MTRFSLLDKAVWDEISNRSIDALQTWSRGEEVRNISNLVFVALEETATRVVLKFSAIRSTAMDDAEDSGAILAKRRLISPAVGRLGGR